MAAITKPSSPDWAEVTPTYTKAKARNVSPFSLQSQTYVWPGSKYTFEFRLPPMRQATAAAWLTFLRDLADADNHFSCVVTGYVPTGVSSPMNLRLVSNSATWFVDRAKRFNISFTAETFQ